MMAASLGSDASAGLHRKYTQAIRVDSRRAGVLVAGNEEGLFRSEDGGTTWKLAGAAGYQVLRVEQSPHDRCFWLASAQGGGLFASTDCGVTFESNGNLGAGRNLVGHRVRSRSAQPRRSGGMGSRRRSFGGSRQDVASRNAGLPGNVSVERSLRPRAPGTHLRQRARGGALRFPGLRPHLDQGRARRQPRLSHDVLCRRRQSR